MPLTELEAALYERKNRTNKIGLLPKVKAFLDSIERNSIKSKRSYSSGLSLLQNFLDSEACQQRYNHNYNCETILEPLSEDRVNIYEFFDSFVSYVLATKPNITPKSLALYLAAAKSYFAFYDIDVIPSKFKRRVKMPRLLREDEQPLDAIDIRKILLNCNNRRLKAYLLTLASGLMSAFEATAIRLKDIDFAVSPTRIHIRPEYAKTRMARDIYISDEATEYVKQWMDWKYRNKKETKEKGITKIPHPDDLVFSNSSLQNRKKKSSPQHLYAKLLEEFQKLLTVSGMAERKESGIHKRRKRKYTGMMVGGVHRWYYERGEWKEKKVAPDKWEFIYNTNKRRAWQAPEGSGVPVGSEYHWYILAHQNVRKLDTNSYLTSMTGLKYKLAHKRVDRGRWSSTDNAQKEQLIRIFEGLITQLKEEMVDESAQNFAPIVESS